MSYRIKAMAYVAVVVFGFATALPSLLPSGLRQHLPAAYAAHTITLGLDLRGGSHLLLQVNAQQLIIEGTLQLGEGLAAALREARIDTLPPTTTPQQGAYIPLRQADQIEQALDIAREMQREMNPEQFDFQVQRTGLLITPTKSFKETQIEDAVERSVKVLRRRLNETGVVEPLITRQGKDNILVQLPGVEDPARIKELLGKTARLSFHLVAGPSTSSSTAVITVPDDGSEQLYRLERSPLLLGSNLTDAQLGFDPNTREPVVNFRLDSLGADLFADITRANIGRAFAVVLDGKVITAPVIRTAIGGGAGQISGGFTSQEAGDLSLLLRAGALPASLTVVEERTVGPELGSDAIQMGVGTGLLGALLVLGFMVAVYGRWGLIANAALLVYSALVIGTLTTLGATLTLPGMAGLILSLGMAVDANILINERIREESRRGISGMYAVHLGFQRAFSTILDSNITTLIAVGLLFMFGTGPIRGFAVAMAVGLAVSMFTSISVTRLLMEWQVRKLGRQSLTFPELRWLPSSDSNIPFMKVRSTGIVLSLCLSLISIGLLFQPGLNTGIDFKGGTILELKVNSTTQIEDIRNALAGEQIYEVAIQEFGAVDTFLIRLPLQADATVAGSTIALVKSTIAEALPDTSFQRLEMVGPSVSAQFWETSLLAVLLAGAGMYLYLWCRFEHYFATGAMLTLALDLTKTLGFFVLLGIEFNLTAIAALLALIGYSVNDKVVVFDRIRENQRLNPDQPLRELIDASLTSTLGRTVFTSATTALAILPMAIAGGNAVASFALPMLFGVVIGTSSSIFIAAPIVLKLGLRFPQPQLVPQQ